MCRIGVSMLLKIKPQTHVGGLQARNSTASRALIPDADGTVCCTETCCQRAELKDGQAILDLGCGWGSMSLYMAQKYPGSQITALSNSNTQRHFIETRAKARGLSNLRVITADVSTFQGQGLGHSFDRVVSIEMFEHMKNYQV